MVVAKPKIIRRKKGDNLLKQIIHEVHNGYLTLNSNNGKLYDAQLDDKVRLRVINAKDTAIIDVDTWKVVDIINREKEPELSDEEEKLELERQNRELEDIGWGEY